MTEEEKKAIEYFKDDINYLEEELKRPNFLGRFITIRDKECKMLKILLNLIEKLQKENGELKNKVIKRDNDIIYLEETAEKEFLTKQEVKENYIPKDKIRELIKSKLIKVYDSSYVIEIEDIIELLKEE